MRFCIPKFGKRFGTRERGRKCTRRFSIFVRKKLTFWKIFSEGVSCRIALARELFKRFLISAWLRRNLGRHQHCQPPLIAPLHCCLLPLAWSVLTVICVAEKTMAIRITWQCSCFSEATEEAGLALDSIVWAIKVRWNQQEKDHEIGRC